MDRDKQRLEGLENEITLSSLSSAWKDTVRHGLRNQDVYDLHDYLDIHKNIGSICKKIKSDVLSENYRTKEPLVISKEKGNGISRRVVVPSARDSILMQTIVNGIEDKVIDEEPTDSAYYSRSHAPPKSFRDVDETFPYAWWNLWPQYQKRIWKFTDEYKYLVVADVSKYFDSIPLDTLKTKLLSIGSFDEEKIDLLFFILRDFVWQPEYVPYHGVGLPQINFDAPRLLSHCYLFDIDEYIEEKNSGDFVRWMDDMNFGVESIEKGKHMLKNIDLKLAGKGLRINSGKTKILEPREAVKELRINDNRYLNLIQNWQRQSLSDNRAKWLSYSKKFFDNFYDGERYGRWEKVIKRFFTIFKDFDSEYLERVVPDVLIEHPGVRDSVFRYYGSIGYTTNRFEQIATFVKSGHCVDDVSLFKSLHLISEWSIPYNSPYRKQSISLVDSLWNRHKSVPLVAGGLRVIGKYGNHQQLWDLVSKTKRTWRASEWGARQIAGISPFLDSSLTNSIRKDLRSEGLLEGLRVLSHVGELKSWNSLDAQMKAYLTSDNKYYPLEKVILTYNHLRGSLGSQETASLRREALSLCNDTVNEITIRNA